jgi:hypothetical protein
LRRSASPAVRNALVPEPLSSTTAPSTATGASTLERTTNWKILSAAEQTTWIRLNSKPWLAMTTDERAEWQRIGAVGPAPVTQAIRSGAGVNDAAQVRDEPAASLINGVTPSTTDPRTEPYWRARRRAIDAKVHEDLEAGLAAVKLVGLMQTTGMNRRDPTAYLKAISDVSRTNDATADDVHHLVPDFYAEGSRASVPEDWLRPSDR